jgi:flagellar protein FlaG
MKADASTAVATAIGSSASQAHAAPTGAKVAREAQTIAAVEKPAQPPTTQEMNAAVRAAARQIDAYLKSVGRELEFHVDEETGTTVVTVRETATGDVIRQIPNEEVLQLARRLERGPGSLLDLTV